MEANEIKEMNKNEKSVWENRSDLDKISETIYKLLIIDFENDKLEYYSEELDNAVDYERFENINCVNGYKKWENDNKDRIVDDCLAHIKRMNAIFGI